MDNKQLMEETLAEAYQYSRKLSDACNTINDCFQGGREQEAGALFHQFLDGLGWISEAFHLTHPLQIEKGIDIDLKKLPEVLRPLEEAWQNQDYGLVGDVLVYEIQPMIEGWNVELYKIDSLG
jgi:hypothetical protein